MCDIDQWNSPLEIDSNIHSNHLFATVESHPLFLNSSEAQREVYYLFVEKATEEFTSFECDDPIVARKWLNSTTLFRFWIARNFKLSQVMEMWIKWVTWYIDFRPDLISKESILENEARADMLRYFKLYKHDKDGNPLVIIQPGKAAGELDIDAWTQVSMYIIEKASRHADKRADGKISVIFDRNNMSQSKDKKWFPIYKMMGQHLQDYYPERLKTAFVVNANWFTKIIISMWKVFLAKETRDKICVIKNLGDLRNYFEDDCLPRSYRA